MSEEYKNIYLFLFAIGRRSINVGRIFRWNCAACVLSSAILNQRDGPLKRLQERPKMYDSWATILQSSFFEISLILCPATIAAMWFWYLMMWLFHHISFCNLEDFNYSNSAPCWHLAIKKICCCATKLFTTLLYETNFTFHAAFLSFKFLNVCTTSKTVAGILSENRIFWDRYSMYRVTLTTRSFLLWRALILMSQVRSQGDLMKRS